MGLFDRMFGRKATEVQQQQPDSQQRFDQLRQKYQTVLSTADQQQIQFHNLHVEGDKLYMKGVAPSDDAKNKLWDQIKLVSPNAEDIVADINVVPQAAAAASAGGGGGQGAGGQSYTVKSGDTLSKISKQFYGDSNEYMRIFYANRGALKDPDKIQVGQELVIPPDDNA